MSRSESAAMPNMRRNVRLKCDESENPAPCAASVNDEPAEYSSTARVNRSHNRYVRLAALAERGQLFSIIDRRIPLHAIATAIGDLEAGRVRGKVVVQMA